ncbi:MAG: hypothetical protein FIA97_08230 [Methylococcaceae bacterium]|nr:hypothetical protein [Methylococcaceae bacterium]
MKHAIKTTIAAGLALVSAATLAEGTKIKDSTIANTSINSQNLNLSIGQDSLASTGSINIRNGAEVANSTILNGSVNTENLNLSIGDRSVATTGSITIE